MKYLIDDTKDFTMGEINKYFERELRKTNLQENDIIVADSLKRKIAMIELQRIFDENGISEQIEFGLEDYKSFHLKHTGHCIEITENEIQSRFTDAFRCILSGIE